MARYQAVLEYDGTDFVGFQRQANGPSIQGEVEAALGRLGWQGASVLGAGRTDSGVHARGQVVAFDLDWRHAADDLQRALNAHLPPAIAAREVRPSAPDFHPRYAARARRYRYTLLATGVRSPLAARFAWQVWPAPDVAAMQAAAAALVGRQDFAAFGTDPDGGGNTLRTVQLARWTGDGSWLSFDIQADAFLYRMVRRIVGALRQVGGGTLNVQDFEGLLRTGDRALCPPPAPPQGLCLEEVVY